MKRKCNLFLAPDDGITGGGPTDILVQDLGDGTQKLDDGRDNTVVTAPTPPTFDPTALASAFAAGLKEAGFSAPAQQPQKQLTPEEAKKLLNVWEPDDEFLAKFDNLDTRKASIAQMRDFLMRQADTISQMRMQEMKDSYDKQFAPVNQYIQEQQAAARETRFNTAYPDLAKPELRSLLTAVVQGLATQKALDPNDEVKSFKAVASAMEAVIKQHNPTFKLSTAGSTPTVKTKNGNALPTQTSGSGGGGGGKVENHAGKAKALSLL